MGELEDRVRQCQVGSGETAELVVLNSYQPHLIEIRSSSDKPVTISLDLCSETLEPGVIGCDCFMEEYKACGVILSREVSQLASKLTTVSQENSLFQRSKTSSQ